MKDLHSHILYGIDDGAKTIEESLRILESAYKNGVTDIVLTPHYIKNTKYNKNNHDKQILLNNLKKELSKRNIFINLYLGNEIYIDESIVELLEEDEITTINNSKYILIELPLNNEFFMLNQVLSILKKTNLIPIIAHPERYMNYYKNYEFFHALIKKGCLFQANIGSLYGKYGKKSKKMLKGMLKRNMIHFLGSDVHSYNSDIYSKNIEKDLLKIVKKQEIVDNLLNLNIEKVLKNQGDVGCE